MALLFIENSNLIKTKNLIFEKSLLYDVDMMYMLTYLQPKCQYLDNVTTMSFKGCKFLSNSNCSKSLDISKLDFSLIFNLTTLKNLNLSHSNFLCAISDSNLEAFCSKL